MSKETPFGVRLVAGLAVLVASAAAADSALANIDIACPPGDAAKITGITDQTHDHPGGAWGHYVRIDGGPVLTFDDIGIDVLGEPAFMFPVPEGSSVQVFYGLLDGSPFALTSSNIVDTSTCAPQVPPPPVPPSGGGNPPSAAPPAPTPPQATPAPPARPRFWRKLRIRKIGPRRVDARKPVTYRIRVFSNRAGKVTISDTMPVGVFAVLRAPRGVKIRTRGRRVHVTWTGHVRRGGKGRTITMRVRFRKNTRGRRCNIAIGRAEGAKAVRTRTCGTVTSSRRPELPAVTG